MFGYMLFHVFLKKLTWNFGLICTCSLVYINSMHSIMKTAFLLAIFVCTGPQIIFFKSECRQGCNSQPHLKSHPNRPFSLYVLISQVRPCDVLQGIFLLSFPKLWIHMRVDARTYISFETNSSLGYCHVVWNGKTKHTS